MADICINYGTDPKAMTYELLDHMCAASEITPDMKVLIKPNLVNVTQAANGATTHPEIVEGIIVYLKQNGIDKITIGESSSVDLKDTAGAFHACGYTRLVDEYDIRLHDMKDDKPLTMQYDGKDYYICSSVLDHDYIINVPVLKGHCQTKITCCMKNLKGLIPDKEKKRYHALGLHGPIAALSGLVKVDLNIVDSICGDLDYEEGGNPVQSDRILMSKDSVLLDSYCAGLIGYDPEDIGYLHNAKAYGLGDFADPDTLIEELNKDHKPEENITRSRMAEKLSKYVEADSACSVCYAALIYALHKLDTKNLTDLGLDDTIKIGQGFKGKHIDGFGSGDCTSGCTGNVRGCPPSAADILKVLKG